MEIPVYLFTGFLESGKSTLIQETLADPEFTEDEKTLLILCEDGEVEFDDAVLADYRCDIVRVDHEADFSSDQLAAWQKEYRPDRVMIEFNGTWSVKRFLEMEPPIGWILVQIITTVDAGTFEAYISNMRSMIYEQLFASQVIIFNRCDETTRKGFLRSNVKATNKQAQIIYEKRDGTLDEYKGEDMPFNLHADVITIQDDDYGIWYMDALENPEKYRGKTVQFKAKVIEKMKGEFVLGRYAMVCCADDLSLIGLLCRTRHLDQVEKDQWITLTASIGVEFDEEYGSDVPILYDKKITSADVPQEELVYFT